MVEQPVEHRGDGSGVVEELAPVVHRRLEISMAIRYALNECRKLARFLDDLEAIT